MRTPYKSLVVSCFALLLLLSVAFQGAAYAAKKDGKKSGKQGDKPGLTWSVKKVEFVPGGATSMQVELRSNVAVQQPVQLRVTGGLGSYITVSPVSIATMAANTPVQITLTLKPHPAAPDSQGGVIHARMGARSLGKPLHVKVKAAKDDDDD